MGSARKIEITQSAAGSNAGDSSERLNLINSLYLSEDGIVELLKEISIYNEEFSTEVSPPIGELKHKLYKCKSYCDFEGKPIKRNNIRIYSDIEVLKKKYHLVFSKYLKLSNDHFRKTKERQQILVRQVFLDYQIPIHILHKLNEHFPVLRTRLRSGKEFSWSDLKEITSSLVPEVELTQFLKYGYVFREKTGYQRVTLRLDSEDYAFKDNKTIFHDVSLFVR